MAKKRVKFKRIKRDGPIELNPSLNFSTDAYEARYIKPVNMRHTQRIQAILDTVSMNGVSSLTINDEEFLFILLESYFEIEIDEGFEFEPLALLSFFVMFMDKLKEVEESNKKK